LLRGENAQIFVSAWAAKPSLDTWFVKNEDNHGTSRQGRDRALVVPTGACQAVSPHSGIDPLRDGQSGRKESGADMFGAST
jgi:hypothetical protein